MAGELLGVLSHLLQQGAGHLRWVPGGRELDRAPTFRLEHLERIKPPGSWVDELVSDQGDPKSALVDVHYLSKSSAS
jgi:hypothetical protein